MDESQREQLKIAMAGRIEELRDEIASLEVATRPVAPDVSIGRLTRMDAIVNKSVNEAGLAAARQNLIKLQNALQTADAEDFGECEECLKPIAVGRMLAMPETTLCVTCATALEADS